MTYRTRAGIALIVLVHALAGCDNAATTPTAPTPVASGEAPPSSGGILMKGTVSDTAFRDLPGARVEILNGPHAGAATIVDAHGEFSFTGLFDETTQFRATSEGHVASVRTLQPLCERCNPNWWINFTLDVLDPPVNVAGAYTLTIVADGTCTMLPPDTRSRSFTATIPEAMAPAPVPGGVVVVPITSATVVREWDVIGVGVAGNHVAFWLETLVEQLAPNRYLSFAGQAAGPVDSSLPPTIVLPFTGTITNCVPTEAGRFEDCYQSSAAARVSCTSSKHQFVLTRR